jgi:hypothetical protein
VSTRARLASSSGYSMIELLVSTAIMITITGAIFSLVTPAQGTSQVQPEIADLQQRMRVGSDVLFRELLMAGAGPYQGQERGSLINYFAPIRPYRTGRLNPDDPTTFKPDVITISYIPNTYSQTTISSPMPNVSAELKVTNQPNCPQGKELCGFEEGMDVIIFDTAGNFDTFTITQVQDAAAHLQHRGQDFIVPYATGSSVTQIETNTYYLDRNTRQLRQYDGFQTDLPLVDNVVDLQFEYFGDPAPPTLPKPPAGMANCLYDAAGNYVGLPTLSATDGSLAPLPEGILTDGPWCGGGSSMFDVDLLRIRKVRVSMRMQVAAESLRGSNAQLFKNPGKAVESARQIPDYMVRFDVSPRNLNLVR